MIEIKGDPDCILCGGTGENIQCGWCMLNVPHSHCDDTVVGPCRCVEEKEKEDKPV